MRNRRDLEHEYRTLSCQIAHLMESHRRHTRALQEMDHLLDELLHFRQRRTARQLDPILDQALEAALSEAKSVIRLANQASPFREQFRQLHNRLAALGQALGYH